MASFSNPHRQAVKAVNLMKKIDGSKSIRTDNANIDALEKAAEFAKSQRLSLRDLTVAQVREHLTNRAEQVGQNQLNVEARALTRLLKINGKLAENEKTIKVESEKETLLKSRAYTEEQVQLIAARQTEKNRLATEVAYAAGLRAHELLTLRPLQERAPDKRPAVDTKFAGREGEQYTVKGKGGLIRVINLPTELAERLESRRLNEPAVVKDREIYYRSIYDVSGGNKWSRSFSSASANALGWSEGAHGLRHSYAQQRMNELQKLGISREDRLITVSQEMGHFRPEITEVYLR